MDEEVLDLFQRNHTKLLILEESIAALAPQIALRCQGCPIRSIAVENRPVAQGTVEQQRIRFGLNREGIETALSELELL